MTQLDMIGLWAWQNKLIIGLESSFLCKSVNALMCTSHRDKCTCHLQRNISQTSFSTFEKSKIVFELICANCAKSMPKDTDWFLLAPHYRQSRWSWLLAILSEILCILNQRTETVWIQSIENTVTTFFYHVIVDDKFVILGWQSLCEEQNVIQQGAAAHPSSNNALYQYDWCPNLLGVYSPDSY